MADGKPETVLTQQEFNRLFAERLQKERRRFEARLEQEKSARSRAEEELRRRDAAQRAGELRRQAADELARRGLPSALLETLRLEDDDSLQRSLAGAEAAFRGALQQGLRERLRGSAVPTAPVSPANEKARAARMSYREAARLYGSDRQAYDRHFSKTNDE